MNTKSLTASSLDPTGPTLDLAHLFHLLRSKAWLVILVMVLAASAAIAYLIWAPKIYESRAVIEVDQETPKVTSANIQDAAPEALADVFKTVEQALLSETLLLRVVKANGLDKDSSFAPPKPDGSPYLDSELAKKFKSKVSVLLRRGTRLIDIIVQDKDPQRAQQLAQSMVRQFVDQSFEQQLDASATTSDFLRQESDRLKAKLEGAEQAVQKYREQHNAVSLEDKQNIIVEKLKELNVKVTEAKSDRLKLEADVATIKQGKVKTPEEMLLLPSVSSLPVVAQLRQELADKQSRFKAESQTRGLQQALDRTLLNTRDMIIKSYEAAKSTEAKLDAALKEQELAALELNKIAIPYNVLVREVETDRALYESVLTRMKVTNVAKGIWANNIHVVESPSISAKPAKPRKLFILALALLGGTVLGCGLVIGIDLGDTSIRSVDQAEKISGLPVLTSIPESKRKDLQIESVLISDPASYEAEAFRSLRTSLSFLGPDKSRKSVLFTSANPGEGKTYCSFNYAVALAQTGLRTLLIDADFRRPDLSRFVLGEATGRGVASCLSGRKSILDCCRPTSVDNLFILGAGSRASKPAELLASCDFAGLLREAALQFDRVILDSAPINAVSDTQLISKVVDSVCVVTRAGKVPRRAIVRAFSLLAQAGCNPDGIIFNRMERRHRDEYYFSEYAGEYANAGARSG